MKLRERQNFLIFFAILADFRQFRRAKTVVAPKVTNGFWIFRMLGRAEILRNALVPLETRKNPYRARRRARKAKNFQKKIKNFKKFKENSKIMA